MSLRRVHAGLYRTSDGRFEISYEEWWLDGECECAICRNGSPDGCPNEGYAKRRGWTVWDTVEEEHVIGEPFAFETFRDAREYLAELLGAAQ